MLSVIIFFRNNNNNYNNPLLTYVTLRNFSMKEEYLFFETLWRYPTFQWLHLFQRLEDATAYGAGKWDVILGLFGQRPCKLWVVYFLRIPSDSAQPGPARPGNENFWMPGVCLNSWMKVVSKIRMFVFLI